MLILPNTQKHGGMKIVAETCLYTEFLGQDHTGVTTKKQLRGTKSNFFLIEKIQEIM